MNAMPLEERVTTLEKTVKAIEERLASATDAPRWRETVGMFRNDPFFKEIVDAGRAIREADRDEP